MREGETQRPGLSQILCPEHERRRSSHNGPNVLVHQAQATLDEDNLADTETSTALENDEVYINIDTSSAVQGLMDVVDLTVDPMQLVMDDADPAASFVGVASWGATAVAGGISIPVVYHHRQRNF